MEHGKKNSTQSFANDPISKIVIKNSLPALIAMIMVMVYNLADTFFIGLTHDDLQVAAVSLASPVFMIFMSLGTLFGVGGCSVISRALGAGKTETAKKACSFCMWAGVAVGVVFMAVLWLFMDDITVMLGVSENTADYTRTYLMITVSCGVFSIISNCLSNVMRSEGEPMKAMTGTVVGNLLNVVLDPIFILAFNWGITGAAVATVIGNVVSAVYYLLFYFGGKSSLSISPRHFSMKGGICKGVLSVGISASLANLLVSVSSIVANGQLAQYGDMYVAGYGVTAKVLLVVTLIGIGVGSGVQPFFGYCYGAKNRQRLTAGLKFSIVFSLCICLIPALLGFVFASPIVKIFLTGEEACTCGVHFTRILMSTAWLIGAFAICQNTLQAMGAATPALLASVFRQGVIFIPALFLLKAIMGVDGLLWAQPVADVLSLVVVVFMLLRKVRAMPLTEASQEG